MLPAGVGLWLLIAAPFLGWAAAAAGASLVAVTVVLLAAEALERRCTVCGRPLLWRGDRGRGRHGACLPF